MWCLGWFGRFHCGLYFAVSDKLIPIRMMRYSAALNRELAELPDVVTPRGGRCKRRAAGMNLRWRFLPKDDLKKG